jgi:hypothetical protein
VLMVSMTLMAVFTKSFPPPDTLEAVS